MSKRAEERALEAYDRMFHNPERMSVRSVVYPTEGTLDYREPFKPFFLDVYQQGYEQAEKDLGWTSVKDRLPDTPEYMITCIDDHGIPQCVGFHYYKDGKWWEGYEEDAVGAVEYWMPIPKLPEK